MSIDGYGINVNAAWTAVRGGVRYAYPEHAQRVAAVLLAEGREGYVQVLPGAVARPIAKLKGARR